MGRSVAPARVSRVAVLACLVVAMLGSAVPSAHAAFGYGFIGKFNAAGRRLAVIRPGIVAFDENRWAAATLDGKSHLIVTPNGVKVVSPTGTLQGFLELPETVNTWDVSVAESSAGTATGDIYVGAANVVYRFKRDGTPVLSWGGKGTARGRFAAADGP